jgi:hypothetical protein
MVVFLLLLLLAALLFGLGFVVKALFFAAIVVAVLAIVALWAVRRGVNSIRSRL